MIYLVALVAPFAPVIVVWVCIRLLRTERREHARERELLTNQLLNLAGKPWQEAPASLRPVPDLVDEPLVYIASPEYSPLT